MNFRLVDSGWDKVLDNALRVDSSSVLVVSPFIKEGAAKRLLGRGRLGALQVITRFNHSDFCDGVSDITALRLLLNSGAQIRGVRNLHAKLYVFGQSRAIVTSANLTEAALTRNHELGFEAEDARIVDQCRKYFDHLWERAGKNLVMAKLAEWESKVTGYLAAGAHPGAATSLGDEGVDLGFEPDPVVIASASDCLRQAFVKFLGRNDNREVRSTLIVDVVRSSGCHRACTYPRGKRPRQVRDGAVLFTSRMVKKPRDTLIFGWTVGMHYEPGRDDASAAEIKKRPFKKRWPHYIRTHNAEFIAGELSNGVSLGELMDALGSNSFASTKRNAAKREGNTDPHRAFRQQPSVELSPEGTAWLNRRLESAFDLYGRLKPSAVDQLD